METYNRTVKVLKVGFRSVFGGKADQILKVDLLAWILAALKMINVC